MRSIAWLLLLASSALVGARPLLEARDDDDSPAEINPDKWADPVRNFFAAVGRRVEKCRESPNFPNAPPCDLSNYTMPAAPTPLPPVATGSTLAHVAVGRGTQNYTCADSTAQSKPVAIGAVARLYNVTCLAATAPETLAYVAASALEYDVPRREDARLAPLRAPPSGRHYFVGGTPLFEVGTKKEAYGSIACKKDASSPAPADAPKGRGGRGFGSVPWLKLTDSGGSTGFREVYRLYTAGGNPPPTCEGQAKTLEIEYATLYFFWK